MKYDLSTGETISKAAALARDNANREQNQAGYNAAWLHGYADALADVAAQLCGHRPSSLHEEKTEKEGGA